MNTIEIRKAGKGVYGQEYKAIFKRNGLKVYELVVFGEDIKYIRDAYTPDFGNAKVIRKY